MNNFKPLYFAFIVLTLLFIGCKSSQEVVESQKVIKKESPFSNYKITEFDFEGHDARIVYPNKDGGHKGWVWRARFWGVEPQVDKALLEEGYHIAYVDVANLFGNNVAVQRWNRFHQHVTQQYGLSQKVVLEGLSRGGLIIYNWAAQNTDKVVCIYADAPVCDIKSWPGGLYTGTGNERSWARCLDAHGVSKEEVLAYKNIPLYSSIKVAEAKIPVLHVYGDADKVVPPSENTELLAKGFKAAGGSIKLIKKEGIGHHPHSLKDPTRIVLFILAHADRIRTEGKS